MINYSNAVMLKNYRRHFGLTQHKLADLLDTTRSQISMAEKGFRPLSAESEYKFQALIVLMKVIPEHTKAVNLTITYTDEEIAEFRRDLEIRSSEAVYRKQMNIRKLDGMIATYLETFEAYSSFREQAPLEIEPAHTKELYAWRINEYKIKLAKCSGYCQLVLKLKIDLHSEEAAVITKYLETY